MKKVAVVYWSQTGNTEALANHLMEQLAGKAEAELFQVSDFSSDLVNNFDAIAFGCPAMGDEMLEDGEFAPVFEECLPALSGKPVALFGSYDWGDGQWMRTWQETCEEAGVVLVGEPLIFNLAPESEAFDAASELAQQLAQ